MIKKRLLKLLSHSTKYIVFQVLWQWISLLCQILTAWSVGQILRNVLGGMPLSAFLSFYLGIIAGTVLVSSGSQMTLDGVRRLSMTTYLMTFSVSMSALTLVISLDVPAVVGIAISGRQSSFTMPIPP